MFNRLSADIEQILYSSDQQSKRLLNFFNQTLNQFSPIEIIILTLATIIILKYVICNLQFVRKTGIKPLLFRFATKLPFVKAKIAAKEKEFYKEQYEHYLSQRKNVVKTIPLKGMPHDQIMKRVEVGAIDSRECYAKSRISGCVYIADDKHWDFVNDVMKRFVVTNALHMDEYQMVTQCEAEIIRMVANLYNGDDKSCGVLTSGGTESILLAILAYREKAKERGVTKPNMVMSQAAHAAFDKAGFFWQVELRKVPVTKDCRADVRAMKNMIDSNTICLVTSSPDYPYGNFDPATEIAALAQKWGIGCHSDCCLGSFVNPFTEEAGYKMKHPVDFRVPGITSISCDPHKYGMGPKGVSVLLFRDIKLRDYQFFATSRWNGGLYATTTIAGSRPGNVVVATWAVMMKIGREGYLNNAKIILDACNGLRKAIKTEIPEVQCATQDNSCVVTCINKPEKGAINCLALKDLLKQHGWLMSTIQMPQGMHISMTLATAADWQKLVKAIKTCIKLMKEKPELNHGSTVATYGMTAKIPDERFINEMTKLHSGALLDAL